MPKWHDRWLDELCSISSGESLPAHEQNGQFPLMGANGQIGKASKANFTDGFLVGRVGAAGEISTISSPCWASDNTLTIRPKTKVVSTKFLAHALRNLNLASIATKTAQPLLTQSQLKKQLLHLPESAIEQETIAQILDTLDTQIQKTEALIAKLEKIKEGLLQDLLTRGIDQNGQLRPTPEQAPELYKESALGLIPAEWELDYLGHLSESGLLNGVFKQPSRVGQGVPLINVADLYKGNKVNLDTCERFNASPTEVSKYSARKGDIFFTRSSLKLEGIAHCNWLDHDVADNSVVYECHVIRIRPTLKVDPHFLVSWCQSRYARRHFMANAKQVTMTTISQDGVASLKCPVPPLPEQTAAVERVKKLEDRIESELSVLKKIRHEKAGLMDDLLTGRVRVTFLLEDAV